MENMSDVIYITGWDSEAELLRGKNPNLPAGISKYYYEDFEDLMSKRNLKLAGTNISVKKERTILVRNPFVKNTYVNFDEAEILFVHAKAQYISEILQNLGAKLFKTKSHDKYEKENSRNLDASGNIKTEKSGEIKSSVKANKKNSQDIEWNFERTDNFSGNYSAESYAKAIDIAEQSGLIHDIYISGLIAQRNPENANRIKSHKISIDMTSEFNKTRDVVLGLTCTNLSLSANYSKILKTKHCVERDIEIEFGE